MPQITQTLHAQLDDCEAKFKAAVDFYSKTRENILKYRDQYHVHMDKFKLYEEEDSPLATEEEEAAQAAAKTAESLSNQLLEARKVVEQLKARYAKLEEVAKGTRVPLPESELEIVAKREAHSDALRIAASKGITPNSIAFKKLEKKIYPNMLKMLRKTNQTGGLSAV